MAICAARCASSGDMPMEKGWKARKASSASSAAAPVSVDMEVSIRERSARPLSMSRSGQSSRKLATRVAVGERQSRIMEERERSRRRSEARMG
eukprot:scaffold184800_cov35-Tisochrysis_lutea.AAC.1